MHYPIAEAMNQKHLEEGGGAASESSIKRAVENTVKRFLKPLAGAGGSEAFIASYLKAKGKDVKVGDIKKRLQKLAQDIQKQLDKKVREDYNLPDAMLLTEGFWSNVWGTMKWLGQPLKWVWGTFSWALGRVMDSWFGKHPAGRIGLGLMLVTLGAAYVPAITELLAVTIPWFVPTTVVLGFSLFFVIETINFFSLMNNSTSLLDFITSTDPKEAQPINYLKYFKAWIPGMQVGSVTL